MDADQVGSQLLLSAIADTGTPAPTREPTLLIRSVASLLVSVLVGALAFLVGWLFSSGLPSLALLIPLCAGATIVDFVAGASMRIRVHKEKRLRL